jgi:hypothetical protein
MSGMHKDEPGLLEKPMVDVRDPNDVRVWTRKLDISPGDLVSAVEQVGTSPRAVLAHLLPIVAARIRVNSSSAEP